jgi:transaldolase
MSNISIDNLRVKLFADGANLEQILELNRNSLIKGFTTNPTLMRVAGVTNFEEFSKQMLGYVSKPISFEVFSDDLDEMTSQALKISSWGPNVYVKIPIMNTRGYSTKSVIEKLVGEKIKVNITAIMDSSQVAEIIEVLNPVIPSYISVFAGRIADTGRDPLPILERSLEIMSENPLAELIWASPREVLNIFQADQIGCHIITATSEILAKTQIVGKDLLQYSRETVEMFRKDAIACNFKI